MGSKSDGDDNALAETITGLYKAELMHGRAPWKTKKSLELAPLKWVSWFNHHRLLEPNGYIPPAEAEENYYRQLTSLPTPTGLHETRRDSFAARQTVNGQSSGDGVRLAC